ncbi:ABC transporter B family protein, putative [Medicago truncatula]|uniref:ABC transporter B family protein, putative n=1 Tax=Medicago truncatula TaxID=3880 RepID=G7JD49_MEDTR|nr:ABC transporter B family protein, putative [Medicago truncatula]
MREEYNKAGIIAEQAISSIRTVYSFAGEMKLGLKQGLAKGLSIGSNGLLFAVWSLMAYYGSRMEVLIEIS